MRRMVAGQKGQKYRIYKERGKKEKMPVYETFAGMEGIAELPSGLAPPPWDTPVRGRIRTRCNKYDGALANVPAYRIAGAKRGEKTFFVYTFWLIKYPATPLAR